MVGLLRQPRRITEQDHNPLYGRKHTYSHAESVSWSSIPVSGVVACHICPRRYYFERSLSTPSRPATPSVNRSPRTSGSARSSIWDEVFCILPTPPEARELFEECIRACQKKPGRGRSVRPHGRSIPSASEAGWTRSSGGAFAITRSSTARPALGTDRLRIACYVACLRETLGEFAGGYVEYIAAVSPGLSNRNRPARWSGDAARRVIAEKSRSASGPLRRLPPPRTVHRRAEATLRPILNAQAGP